MNIGEVRNAGCTIFSKNYIAQARVLYNSWKKHNGKIPFYGLLVDKDENSDLTNEEFEIIQLSELGIPDLEMKIFKFGIVELNTNVKAFFLQYLFRERNIEKLIYLDPDICIYSSLNKAYSLLENYSILLTPHILTDRRDSLEGKCRINDITFLKNGVFNLGFVAVKNDVEGSRFLKWWEYRCMEYGFDSPEDGLFVDQKWVNLAPCIFDAIYIIKDVGYNMAYWNLSERTLSRKATRLYVNKDTVLTFFHFSGFDFQSKTAITKADDFFDLTNRKDLREICMNYYDMLRDNGVFEAQKYVFYYGHYDNGEKISKFARLVYAKYGSTFGKENPFSAKSNFYKWVCRNHLNIKQDVLNRMDVQGVVTKTNYSFCKYLIDKFLFIGIRSMIFIFGIEKYEKFVVYFINRLYLSRQILFFKR